MCQREEDGVNLLLGIGLMAPDKIKMVCQLSSITTILYYYSADFELVTVTENCCTVLSGVILYINRRFVQGKHEFGQKRSYLNKLL